jgi:acetyl-CoA carboxylase biotin carboxylase subunit
MQRKLKRIFIANRGEIAVRIIRTLRELEIESVAVFSEADSESMHRFEADFAIPLKGSLSSETYLNIPQLIEALKRSGADGVHPGYGFLSENTEFCKAVEKLGIKFVGPSSRSMALLGDKTAAKALMKEHNVPTTPGSDGELKSVKELKEVTARIGFPIILKAAAGGGGRGMRIIRNDSEMQDSFDACKREALSYFGDDRIFAEKYIERPRHIEIQVLCDGHGGGVHLFERDCSIQRRHQKLIEEAPSAFLSAEQRNKLGEIAVRAALAASYEGVGTVEFICESPDNAYFMEVNTRIQVEHPVTEMVTGIDLIKEQIKVACGNPLPFKQQDIKLSGWSFEARINAEDASRDFLPSAGKVTGLQFPMGPFVRVDSHLYDGYEIPAIYDSMIAKVIVWGQDREEAIARLRRALRELSIGGVRTTANFHEALLSHPLFVKGDFTTKFMDDEFAALKSKLPVTESEDSESWAALLIAILGQTANGNGQMVKSEERTLWQRQARFDGIKP